MLDYVAERRLIPQTASHYIRQSSREGTSVKVYRNRDANPLFYLANKAVCLTSTPCLNLFLKSHAIYTPLVHEPFPEVSSSPQSSPTILCVASLAVRN
jgi:hypothetical protein